MENLIMIFILNLKTINLKNYYLQMIEIKKNLMIVYLVMKLMIAIVMIL